MSSDIIQLWADFPRNCSAFHPQTHSIRSSKPLHLSTKNLIHGILLPIFFAPALHASRSLSNCSSCGWWAKRPSRRSSATCCCPAIRSRGRWSPQCDIQCGDSWPQPDRQWGHRWPHTPPTTQRPPTRSINHPTSTCHRRRITLPRRRPIRRRTTKRPPIYSISRRTPAPPPTTTATTASAMTHHRRQRTHIRWPEFGARSANRTSHTWNRLICCTV